ncbi:MAG: neutral amino acid transport system permease protein [Acidimicrobiales bacterium]|jgi:neutral amino acid transport system permease protein
MRRNLLRTVILVFSGLTVALAALVLSTSPVDAQDGNSSVKGQLEAIDAAIREPVEGVLIVVEQDGVEVGTANSAADGSWEIPVPAGGVYQVTLDVDSLPDGVAPTDPATMSLDDVSVRDGQNKTVRFNLGAGVTSAVSEFERFKDLVIVGLKLGAIIALAAVGLSLVFGVTGLVNFAHGELITLGAVLAYFFHVSDSGPGWPLLVAAIPAMILTAGFGAANDLALWRPLRRRQTGAVAMLVISIGLSFAVRNLVLVIFGGEPRNYDDFLIQDEWSFLGFSTPPKNLIIIGTAVVILGAVGLFLQRTRAGVAVRAVADNKDLAESSGIDVNRVILITWVLGAGLASLSGIFLGVSEQIQWDAGFKILLLIFAAVVLGGLGTAFGAMLGGFVIGLSVEVSTFWIPTELKNAVALGLLIIMLLWRPQGLLGTRERIG